LKRLEFSSHENAEIEDVSTSHLIHRWYLASARKVQGTTDLTDEQWAVREPLIG
jgi:hypothetical protein